MAAKIKLVWRFDQRDLPLEMLNRNTEQGMVRRTGRSIRVCFAGTMILYLDIVLMNFIALLIKLAFALLPDCDMDGSAAGTFYWYPAD